MKPTAFTRQQAVLRSGRRGSFGRTNMNIFGNRRIFVAVCRGSNWRVNREVGEGAGGLAFSVRGLVNLCAVRHGQYRSLFAMRERDCFSGGVNGRDFSVDPVALFGRRRVAGSGGRGWCRLSPLGQPAASGQPGPVRKKPLGRVKPPLKQRAKKQGASVAALFSSSRMGVMLVKTQDFGRCSPNIVKENARETKR